MTIPDFNQNPLASVFGLIALPLFVASVIFASRSIDYLRHSHPVQGVVSKVLVRGTTINKKALVEAPLTNRRGEYYPVIGYSIGGNKYSFRQKVSEAYAPLVGESRSILVSSTNPSIAKSRHFSQFAMAPLVLFLFAAVFGSGAFMIYRFGVSDIEERSFLTERAPRVHSSQITIQENILDRAPAGKRTRYLVAGFLVNGKLFTARSKPRMGDFVVPASVTIAYDPDDPSTCLILAEAG